MYAMLADSFDSRFVKEPTMVKAFFDLFMGKMTPKDLKDILEVAKRLEIEDYGTRPAVDILYEVACKLSILEAEIITPSHIMDKVREYLANN